MIEEVEYSKIKILKYLCGGYNREPLIDIPSNIIYTGTGRSALRIILENLRNKGILPNRNSEVLIPQWLCQGVIYTMHRFCHPTLTVTKNLKAVLVYHQYGFPQNMDEICEFCNRNNLYLIEDCANVYESYYKGRRLGTFGSAAIFSFSKFFPSVLGGALITSDKELYEYGKERLGDSKYSSLSYFSQFIYGFLKNTVLKQPVSDLHEMVATKIDGAYSIKNISLRITSGQLSKGALEQRKRNYEFVLNYFSDRPEYFWNLESEGVIPYVVPLFDKETNLAKMKRILVESNIATDIYHFDVNRNLLNPCFQKCIWIPIHQGLNISQLGRICTLIKGVT